MVPGGTGLNKSINPLKHSVYYTIQSALH